MTTILTPTTDDETFTTMLKNMLRLTTEPKEATIVLEAEDVMTLSMENKKDLTQVMAPGLLYTPDFRNAKLHVYLSHAQLKSKAPCLKVSKIPQEVATKAKDLAAPTTRGDANTLIGE